jgi:hypothetical protein
MKLNDIERHLLFPLQAFPLSLILEKTSQVMHAGAQAIVM